MRRRDERGAIALVTAAVMVVLLGVAAFVVDIGMQRVARQDLQALADVVALDLARMLDGRTAYEITEGDPSLEEAKADSQARNDDDTVGEADDLEVTPTLLVPEEDGTGWRTADPDEEPEAVRVETSTTVDFGFAGAIGFSSGGAARTSIASARSSACFHLGSYADAVRDDPSLIASLDDLVELGLSDDQYLALAAAVVSLKNLAEQPQIGDPNRLLDTRPLRDLLTALAGAVGAGPASAALIDARDAVDPSTEIALGDVVGILTTDADALKVSTPVLDLVGTAVLVSAGVRELEPVDLEGGAITFDGTWLKVARQQQRICLQDQVQAPLMTVEFDASLTLPDERGLSISGTAPFDLQVGGSDHAFSDESSPECRETDLDSDRYSVSSSGLSSASFSVDVVINGVLEDPPSGVTSITVEAVNITRSSQSDDVSSSTGAVNLEVPANAVNEGRNAVETGVDFVGFRRLRWIPQSSLGGSEVTIVTEEGLEGEQRDEAIRRAQQQLRVTVNGALRRVTGETGMTVASAVEPYADVLGVRRAGVDLYSEARPTCNGISLVG